MGKWIFFTCSLEIFTNLVRLADTFSTEHCKRADPFDYIIQISRYQELVPDIR
jgi:hypothetical protein